MKVVIVGGVAGGMSCAARLRRLDESLEIVVFEKGRDVSFANCGMPYFVGGIIEDRDKMLVQTPEGLKDRYALDIRIRHEALAIDRAARRVSVKDLETGTLFDESYDRLVLATGAEPAIPPVPGADGETAFVLNDLAQMDRIAAQAASARRAVVVGGGFIGLELAENLRARGVAVTLVEMADQVLPPFDREMTGPVLAQLEEQGIEVLVAESVSAIGKDWVALTGGGERAADFVCLAAGVRPASRLARDAGLALEASGHVRVEDRMVTSDPTILAVGDVTGIADRVTGERTAVPLAGPANRQGRIAADTICGRDTRYRGTLGTAIVRVFGVAAAITGQSEKALRARGRDYRRIYVHPTQHPGYYPGAEALTVKLLFDPAGPVLGAQVVGAEGVKSMIDTFSTAIGSGLAVNDLVHLELAYAPQWGGAKDPVNMAGLAAANLLDGTMKTVEADEERPGILWLDVRNADELEEGRIPGSLHIPLNELRGRTGELPRDREIGVSCAAGQRGYIGERFLRQKGFRARTLNGGFRTWRLFHPDGART